MNRNKYIDERLQAWAQWKCIGAGGYRGIDFSKEYDGPAFVDYTPSLEFECIETDMAIASLPMDLKRMVVAVYTWDGGLDVVVSKLGVTRQTIHRRLCHADVRIDEFLTARQERGKQIFISC